MADTQQFTRIVREWMDTFTHRSMREWAHYVKTTGFSMPQFFILMQVHHRSQCGISDLSESMEISSAAASQMVDRLVQHGLLERAEDPHDRRAKQITISARGRDLIQAGVNERYRWVEELALTLSPSEQEQVAGALVTLLDAARRMEDSVSRQAA